MKILRLPLAVFLAVAVFTLAARAADLTGNWKWISQGTSGPVRISATFVHKDGNLTGTVTGRQGPAEISNASIKDDVVTFTVTRGTTPNRVIFTYTGKITGDTIIGTIEKDAESASPSKSDWKAKRVK